MPGDTCGEPGPGRESSAACARLSHRRQRGGRRGLPSRGRTAARTSPAWQGRADWRCDGRCARASPSPPGRRCSCRAARELGGFLGRPPLWTLRQKKVNYVSGWLEGWGRDCVPGEENRVGQVAYLGRGNSRSSGEQEAGRGRGTQGQPGVHSPRKWGRKSGDRWVHSRRT